MHDICDNGQFGASLLDISAPFFNFVSLLLLSEINHACNNLTTFRTKSVCMIHSKSLDFTSYDSFSIQADTCFPLVYGYIRTIVCRAILYQGLSVF